MSQAPKSQKHTPTRAKQVKLMTQVTCHEHLKLVAACENVKKEILEALKSSLFRALKANEIVQVYACLNKASSSLDSLLKRPPLDHLSKHETIDKKLATIKDCLPFESKEEEKNPYILIAKHVARKFKPGDFLSKQLCTEKEKEELKQVNLKIKQLGLKNKQFEIQNNLANIVRNHLHQPLSKLQKTLKNFFNSKPKSDLKAFLDAQQAITNGKQELLPAVQAAFLKVAPPPLTTNVGSLSGTLKTPEEFMTIFEETLNHVKESLKNHGLPPISSEEHLIQSMHTLLRTKDSLLRQPKTNLYENVCTDWFTDLETKWNYETNSPAEEIDEPAWGTQNSPAETIKGDCHNPKALPMILWL